MILNRKNVQEKIAKSKSNPGLNINTGASTFNKKTFLRKKTEVEVNANVKPTK